MTKTYFKLILTLSWLLIFVGLVVDVFTESTLPPILIEYIETQDESFQFTPDLIIISIIYIGGFVASYIGLYLWKDWGRMLFLAILVFGYVLTPFYPEPTVSTIWAEDIYSITYILIGILIGMMYFSKEITENFKKTRFAENKMVANNGINPTGSSL